MGLLGTFGSVVLDQGVKKGSVIIFGNVNLSGEEINKDLSTLFLKDLGMSEIQLIW